MGDNDGDEDGDGVDGDGFRGHFPVPAACQNRDLCPPNLASRWRRRPWSLSGVSSIGVGFLGHEGLNRRRGGVGGARGSLLIGWRGLEGGRAALWGGPPGTPLRRLFAYKVPRDVKTLHQLTKPQKDSRDPAAIAKLRFGG